MFFLDILLNLLLTHPHLKGYITFDSVLRLNCYLCVQLIFSCMSTSKSKFVETGLTFDDVLLVPAYSEVLPSEVNLHSKFSKNLSLKVPIVSAAMDTVTK